MRLRRLRSAEFSTYERISGEIACELELKEFYAT